MNYSLILENNITYVDFHGVVDELDFVQRIKNPEFILSLYLNKNLLHESNGIGDVDLDIQEVKRIALLANVVANFIENLNISIIIDSPSLRSLAEYFKSKIASSNWHIHIVDHKHEAIALLTE